MIFSSPGFGPWTLQGALGSEPTWLKGTDRGERPHSGATDKGRGGRSGVLPRRPSRMETCPPTPQGLPSPERPWQQFQPSSPPCCPLSPPPQVLTPWALPWECPACPSPSPRTRPATGLRVGSPKSREEERKGSKLKRTALSQTLQNGAPLMKGSDPTPLDGIHPRPNTIVSKGFP